MLWNKRKNEKTKKLDHLYGKNAESCEMELQMIEISSNQAVLSCSIRQIHRFFFRYMFWKKWENEKTGSSEAGYSRGGGGVGKNPEYGQIELQMIHFFRFFVFSWTYLEKADKFSRNLFKSSYIVMVCSINQFFSINEKTERLDHLNGKNAESLEMEL